LFVLQEDEDEDAASLADVLETLLKLWPEKQIGKPTPFTAKQIAEFVNNEYDHSPEKSLLRDWLRPDVPPNQQISAKTIGRQLKRHLDEPVMSGKRALTLRAERNPHTEVHEYHVAIKQCSV
jgi:hypothetical protein